MTIARLIVDLHNKFAGKIQFVLVGGFAVNAYGVTRQTRDIDFMIVESDFDLARKIVETTGYSLDQRQDIFARFKNEKADLNFIDLLFVDKSTLDSIVQEGRRIKIAGVEIYVPSLFHLIGMKFHAAKHNPIHRMGKDMWDIVQLINVNKVDIHSEPFQSLCLKFGTPALYEQIKISYGPKRT